ncbi:815_t:CDS:2, partial [Entrophospora sp. SA101]
CDNEAVNFDSEKKIDKFIVDCEEDVLNYLDKFYKVNDLESLGSNDFLIQTMSEYEFNSYIWMPLLRNAFLDKKDLKLNYGELASRLYEKLKELMDIGGRSAPKLDGKGFLKSLGTEILAQEDGVLNTQDKRKGDLQKLEYCSKVILTMLFFALPSAAKASIKNIETY